MHDTPKYALCKCIFLSFLVNIHFNFSSCYLLSIRTFSLFREELRGISRGKNAKDVDWSKVAASIVDTEIVSVERNYIVQLESTNVFESPSTKIRPYIFVKGSIIIELFSKLTSCLLFVQPFQ